MRLSDYLAQFLVRNNIGHVFQIIGGASVHMVDSLAKEKRISYVCVEHEQAGAMAAESYSRMTKHLGAAMATSGPGMTNLITGIACAYFDSIPVLYFTGQVNTYESKQGRKVRQVGFQETDIVPMVASITKFAYRIEDPSEIRYILEKAVYIARSGRQGPVLLDIPMDIQRAEIDPNNLKRFDPKEIQLDVDPPKKVAQDIARAVTLLRSAKRPVVIVGGGIRYADVIRDAEKLVRTLNIPIVSTWSGIDVIHHDFPNYIGQTGVYGNRAANFTVQNSDCMLSLGTRLDTRITGGKPETFARAAKKIIVDIDRAELFKHRGLEPDIGICADVAHVMPLFTNMIQKHGAPRAREWLTVTRKWKQEYPAVLPKWYKRKKEVDPYVFVRTLSHIASNHATVITDCGANLTWTIQGFHVRKGQRLFSAMGNSPMGYAFPASIGASIALGKKPVICIIGDGGMQINIQDLQTVVHYRVPVKIFILNNHSYGIILQFQEMYFNGRYEATLPKSGYSMPDFCAVAKAYGIATERISSHRELSSKIKRVLEHRGPILCEVIIPQHAKLIPKLSFGDTIEDMSPKLSDKEFNDHMLIQSLRKK